MSDVAVWIYGSWSAIKRISLVRSWRKLLDRSGNEFQESREETEHCEIIDFFEENSRPRRSSPNMVKLENGWGRLKTMNF